MAIVDLIRKYGNRLIVKDKDKAIIELAKNGGGSGSESVIHIVEMNNVVSSAYLEDNNLQVEFESIPVYFKLNQTIEQLKSINVESDFSNALSITNENFDNLPDILSDKRVLLQTKGYIFKSGILALPNLTFVGDAPTTQEMDDYANCYFVMWIEINSSSKFPFITFIKTLDNK